MLDTCFWILGISGFYHTCIVGYRASSIEYLPGKCNYQKPTCISSWADFMQRWGLPLNGAEPSGLYQEIHSVATAKNVLKNRNNGFQNKFGLTINHTITIGYKIGTSIAERVGNGGGAAIAAKFHFSILRYSGICHALHRFDRALLHWSINVLFWQHIEKNIWVFLPEPDGA